MNQESVLYRRVITSHCADRERIYANIVKPEQAHSVRLPRRRALIWAAAAVLLLTATVTAAATGIRLSRKQHSIDSYLLQTEEQRQSEETAIADIERMIEREQLTEIDRSIALSSEDPDLAWLSDIRPEAVDVIVSGQRMIVQTRLYCPHAEAFDPFGHPNGLQLDVRAEDGTLRTESDLNGMSLVCTGFGINPYGATAEYGLAMAEYALPSELPASGTVTVTERLRIQDCAVDDLGPTGTVAILTHSFSFDASALCDAAEPLLLSVPLAGTQKVTLAEDGLMRTDVVSLDGTALAARVQFRQTGLAVRFDWEQAGDLDEAVRQAILCGSANPASALGLIVTCRAGDAVYTANTAWNEPDGTSTFVLPIYPSQYAELGTVRFELRLAYATAVNHAEGTEWTLPSYGYSVTTAMQEPFAAFTISLP